MPEKQGHYITVRVGFLVCSSTEDEDGGGKMPNAELRMPNEGVTGRDIIIMVLGRIK